MSLVDLGKRLLESSKHGNTDEVRSLMSNGAPFTTDWLGTSPLHFAAQNGHLTTVETLLRAGISRDARTKVDRTPLHVAAQEGHMHICNLLLEHQADVDAKDMLKMTPLHWAAEKSHADVIQLLLTYGADVNSADKFDRTPIDIPFTNGRDDIAQILQLSPGVKSLSSIPMDLEGDYTHETVITETEITDSDLIQTADDLEQEKVTSVRLNQNLRRESGDNTTAELRTKEVGSSTSVLSTLAALAEATASTTPLKRAKTSEALSWLENHGITMVSANDGNIVTSAVQSGQSVALTEAGKLAIDLIKTEYTDDKTANDTPVRKTVVNERTQRVLDSRSERHVIVQDIAADGEDGSREIEIMVDIEDVGDDQQLIVTEIASHDEGIPSDGALISVAGETTIDDLETVEPPLKRTRHRSKQQALEATSLQIQKQVDEVHETEVRQLRSPEKRRTPKR